MGGGLLVSSLTAPQSDAQAFSNQESTNATECGEVFLMAPEIAYTAYRPAGSFSQMFGGAAIAQVEPADPVLPDPIEPGSGIEVYLNWYSFIYMALISLLGFVHNFVPVLTVVTKKWVRIVLGGILIAVIFILNGFGDGISLAIAFATSIGLYEMIFKRVGLTSPPVTRTGVVPTKTPT